MIRRPQLAYENLFSSTVHSISSSAIYCWQWCSRLHLMDLFPEVPEKPKVTQSLAF